MLGTELPVAAEQSKMFSVTMKRIHAKGPHCSVIRCVELNATLTMTRPTGRVSRELTYVKKHKCISVTGVLVGLQEFEVHGFHCGKMVSLVLQVKILRLCFESGPEKGGRQCTLNVVWFRELNSWTSEGGGTKDT